MHGGAFAEALTERGLQTRLTPDEVDAILAAPNRERRIGRRDHALLTLAIQTGLRVTELTTLRNQDVHLSTGPHIQVVGKGRKQRATPLTSQTVSAVLRQWLKERAGRPEDPLFPSSRGRALSRDAIALLVTNHASTASRISPTLKNKKVSPHTLRHTTAMNLLHAGVDSTVIALWLGHESVEATQIYLHADMAIKERALAENHSARHRPRQIPATRPTARVPRSALIMPRNQPPNPANTTDPGHRSA